MGDVINWFGKKSPPSTDGESQEAQAQACSVLCDAIERDLETVMVIGRTRDGDLYFNSSTPDGGDVLWLMEIAKRELMDMD